MSKEFRTEVSILLEFLFVLEKYNERGDLNLWKHLIQQINYQLPGRILCKELYTGNFLTMTKEEQDKCKPTLLPDVLLKQITETVQQVSQAQQQKCDSNDSNDSNSNDNNSLDYCCSALLTDSIYSTLRDTIIGSSFLSAENNLPFEFGVKICMVLLSDESCKNLAAYNYTTIAYYLHHVASLLTILKENDLPCFSNNDCRIGDYCHCNTLEGFANCGKQNCIEGKKRTQFIPPRRTAEEERKNIFVEIADSHLFKNLPPLSGGNPFVNIEVEPMQHLRIKYRRAYPSDGKTKSVVRSSELRDFKKASYLEQLETTFQKLVTRFDDSYAMYYYRHFNNTGINRNTIFSSRLFESDSFLGHISFLLRQIPIDLIKLILAYDTFQEAKKELFISRLRQFNLEHI